MLLQIHDELIFEVPNVELNRISNIIEEEMTSVVNSDFHSFSSAMLILVSIFLSSSISAIVCFIFNNYKNTKLFVIGQVLPINEVFPNFHQSLYQPLKV